ncbi:hypothetical protein [Arthrobacter sp. A2-55]|uniref:hypothetical protein n=1 Tax=Arthrobacter sp. A2-55 TaxID=2897337 RepID=UPI0021CDE6AE|nr:hypothetical protein [Arthrobacter sp. A2-55]MCU6479106.1 hypothetical protein [Arthrobacter sp. A2-55]
MIKVQPTLTADNECLTALQQYAAGALDETETRKAIAAALHRSGVVIQVARERMLSHTQMVNDLCEDMNDLLYRKIMQTAPGGFDLNLGLYSSATGWARQLLRAARATLLRDLRTRTEAKLSLVDPIAAKQEQEGVRRDPSYRQFHGAAYQDKDHEDSPNQKIQDAVEWYQSKARHLRDSTRLAASAASIMHGLGVPALVRPRLAERRRLQGLLHADPSLAHRSLRAMRSLIEGEPGNETIDEGLLALWDDYSYDQIDATAQAPFRMASVLVDAALADRARPPRPVLRAFIASVRALGTGRGWSRLAAELSDTFIALEFEAYSSFDTSAADQHKERLMGRRIAILNAHDVFNRVLAHPGQRLGMTEHDLYDQLDRLITSLTEYDVKVPEAA